MTWTRPPFRLLAGASWVTLAGLLLSAVLRELGPGPLGAVLTLLPPLAFALPVLGLLLAAALRRQRQALAVNLVSVLLVAVVIAPPSLSGTRPGSLTLATWNLEGGAEGRGQLPQAVASLQADVLFMQETEPNPDDPMPGIRAALPGYHEVRSAARPELVVLSRQPLGPGVDEPLGAGPEHMALKTTLSWQGREVTLLGVHINPNRAGEVSLGPSAWRDLPAYVARTTRSRQEQFQALERLLARQPGPVLLAGDFNTPPAGSGPRLLRTRLQDTFAEAGLGWGLTFPATFPLWRIDFVWASREWEVGSARVGPGGASDHRAALAVVSLR